MCYSESPRGTTAVCSFCGIRPGCCHKVGGHRAFVSEDARTNTQGDPFPGCTISIDTGLYVIVRGLRHPGVTPTTLDQYQISIGSGCCISWGDPSTPGAVTAATPAHCHLCHTHNIAGLHKLCVLSESST